MAADKLGLITVAVPPHLGGMRTWLESVVSLLQADWDITAFAISHRPDLAWAECQPADVRLIKARLHYPRMLGATLPKFVRWRRLFGEFSRNQRDAVAQQDLLITDATPGIVALGRRLHEEYRLPWVVFMGGNPYIETRHQFLSRLRHGLYTRALQQAARIVVDGADIAGELRQRGLPEQRIALAPHGIDVEAFSPENDPGVCEKFLREQGIELRGRLVISHGRCDIENGSYDLIHILRDIPEATCIVFGPGYQAPSDTTPGVHWLGPLEGPVLHSLVGRADLGVYPFHRTAGLPRAVLEAMAAQTAVVTTSTGSLRDVISDGVNGRLLPIGDGAGIRQAVLDLVAHDTQRENMARQARETVLARFRPVKVREFYLKLLSEVKQESAAGTATGAPARPGNDPR